MRTKIASYIICALIIISILVNEVPKCVNAQVTEEWVARYNSPDSLKDMADAVTVDQWGNVYVTGSSEGPFGSGIDSDIITVAYDAAGNEKWIQRYDGPESEDDGPVKIAVDTLSGNIYVTGWCNGLGLDVDYVTLAYDQSGKELWVARYNSVYNDRDIACDIALDSSGNIYVTGSSYGPLTEGGTAYDYVTIVYDISGNELWMARYNGPGDGNDNAVGLGLDSAGNVYVFGDSSGLGEGRDFLTVAYDSSGNQLWAARYDGGYTGDWAKSMTVDPAGRVYVTGYCDHGYGVYYYDFVTIAYDSSGNELWMKRYNSPSSNYDWVFDITLTSNGDVVVTGNSRIVFGEDEFTTVAYDPMGNELWVATYQGPDPNFNSGWAITADNQGNVFVTGVSSGLTSRDIATIAYDSFGNELWVLRYNGPEEQFDWGYDIAADGFGNVYVTGYSHSLTTNTDFVTIKYSPSKPNIRATIDIDPSTLNLKSKGKWITCYITLNSPFDVNDIDITTILLEDTIPAERGDIQGDRLMVKFDRSAVHALLPVGTYNLKVTGELTDGTSFEGYSDEIRVIDPGK